MKKIALVLACCLAPALASAHDFDYTFVEGGYTSFDGQAEGPYVKGSYEFGDSGVYAFGQYTQVETELFDLDVDQAEIGVGYAHTVHQRVDLFGELAYQHVDTDFVDLDGYRVSLGARVHVWDKLDGLVRVNHYDGGDFVADRSVTAGLEYGFNDRWSVVGEAEFNGSDRAYQLGARYSF